MRGDGPLGLPAAEPTHLEQLCSRRVLGWLERRQVLIEQRRTQRLPVAEPSCAEPQSDRHGCARAATCAQQRLMRPSLFAAQRRRADEDSGAVR